MLSLCPHVIVASAPTLYVLPPPPVLVLHVPDVHHILPLSLVEWCFRPIFENPHARVLVLVGKPAFSTSSGDARGPHYVIGSDYHDACDF